MFEIRPYDVVAVQPVDRKDEQNRKVGNQHRPVEPSQLMYACEWVVEDILNQPFRRGSIDQQSQQWT
jgi:hypothetical protein